MKTHTQQKRAAKSECARPCCCCAVKVRQRVSCSQRLVLRLAQFEDGWGGEAFCEAETCSPVVPWSREHVCPNGTRQDSTHWLFTEKRVLCLLYWLPVTQHLYWLTQQIQIYHILLFTTATLHPPAKVAMCAAVVLVTGCYWMQIGRKDQQEQVVFEEA